MSDTVDFDRRQQVVLLAVLVVVAAVLGVVLYALPLGLGWQESLVLAAIVLALGVVELVIDDTSF